ncbi:unnamed protein product [Chironomus riparius]|uniref:Uncharacterized protein n=1 Tax=Chironomus riparius TaxID=315576 RepID=A0A9N9WZ48_9DIPT|nr:unnamed protein product [Chironomus riparius]
MEVFFIFVSLLLIFANGNQYQSSKYSAVRNRGSYDLNAIESILQTDQKAVNDVIEKSIQQVETLVKTLEDNDIREADDVKKLLEFLVDTSAPEAALVRHKRQIQPIMPLDATVDTTTPTFCTEVQNSYQKANNLSSTARNVMSSSASSISAATDSMNTFLTLSANADPFMKEIYLNLAKTMKTLITIQTKTMNDVQNALFELTYAGATYQEQMATKNCANSTDPPVVKYTTPEAATTNSTTTVTTTTTVSQSNQNAESVQCPKCFMGTIQCPVIIALGGPSSGTCPAGRTMIKCSFSEISRCCCK